MQKARFCQLLLGLGRLFEGHPQTSWRGLGLFVENKVPPNDPRRQVVSGNFARNLASIVQAGLDARAKILLSTVAVNLKDCPPFATAATNHLAPADLARHGQLCAEAAAAETAGNFADARRFYEQALTLSPDSAELQFRLGRCCLRLEDAAAARRHFQLAVDLDSLPFRADSRINDLIREAGGRFAGPNLALCDAAAVLAAGSPAGIPGEELFYEHVHLNFDGNYRLALAWAESLQKLLPPALAGRATGSWASQEVCERRLGLTDWNRLSVFEEIGRRLNVAPFSAQLDNSARLERVRLQTDAIRRRTTDSAIEPARAVYVEALRRAPDDFKLHENFAEFLNDVHEGKAAIAERQKVCELIPHYYFPFFSLGELLRDQGRLPEALESLQKAAALAPRSGEIRFEIGTVYARQAQWTTALAEFHAALQLGWDDPRLHLYAGEVLWKLNRNTESVDELRQAIRLEPGFWEAHYRLGDEMASTGDTAAAAAEFERVTQLNPRYVKAHLNLGVALAKLGRVQEAVARFDEVLRLDPANAPALEFKRQAERQIRSK